MDLVGAGAAAGALEHERAPDAPLDILSPPHRAIDDFLDAADAEALRASIDDHFAAPHAHRPETHQVWNYWHVPGLYTYLRATPERIIPESLVRRFHTALSRWAAETLGMGFVTWPCLSLYVDGCVQNLHNDSANGRFGFVYSLTRDDRRSRGGETIVLKEGDLMRANVARAGAGSGLQDLIAPRFNRLVVFDDRMPHGVQRIEGSMDPLDGRIVLHGHISEGDALVEGPLAANALWSAVRPELEPAMAAASGCHGPLTLRLAIGADGLPHDVRILLHRVVRQDGGDVRPHVEAVVSGVRQARFPAAAAASQATLPILFGGPLPWMRRAPEEGLIKTRVSAATMSVAAKPIASAPRIEPAAAAAAPSGEESAARAAIGAAVRAKLAQTPGVARIPKDRLEAYVVPHFLSAEECEGLMRLIDAGRVPSGLLAPSADPEFRTSESCNLSPADPLVGGLEARINKLMGIEPQFGETVQGQRYAVGQQFKPHHDFFHTSEAYWKEQAPRGGQRTWTVMAFLNKPDAGGQTAFPKAGLKITPAPAHLLIWNNLDVNGDPNDFSLHQGMPVEAGTKYVLTKWYRERPWSGFTGVGLAYH